LSFVATIREQSTGRKAWPGDLPSVVVANMHARYTGVSATIAALVPHQRASIDIGVVDWDNLGLTGTARLRDCIFKGYTAPKSGRYRIWHARRDVEVLAGLMLRSMLRQQWKVVFTSAAPKQPNRFLKYLMRQADAVIATSDRSAKLVDLPCEIIPHGVDTDLFTPPQDRARALAETGLPGKYAIGLFGRIRYSKGTDLFVRAMIELLPKYPNYIAVMTGFCKPEDRQFKAELERLIAGADLEDRILFLGQLTNGDVRRWYQRVSLCVAASRQEGFGLTPLEAFASGAPALTSNAGAWPGFVDDEVGGRFETGRLESLVKALDVLMADPERLQRLGVAARQRAVERHSIQHEAQAINAAYQRLIG
jgi:mannosyltransferase